MPRLVVLSLALLALVLQGGSLAHQHLDAQPGLFNHDHDLSTLATVSGALIPDGPEAGPARIALDAQPTPVAPIPALAPRRHANPRAPPLSEPPSHS